MKCPHCIGGFIQTSMGPKPCPYCNSTGEISENSSDETEYKKPLIDTSDWWNDGTWLIVGPLILGVLYGLVKSCG